MKVGSEDSFMLDFYERWWRHFLVAWILLLAGVVAASEGLQLRRWAWDYSQGVHFQGDISNAFFWGHYAQDHGLFAVYDDNLADNANIPESARPRGSIRKIDYTPLRLTAAFLWYRWAHARYPDADTWQDDYDFTMPLLTANTIAEGSSAILVFALIWLWRRRDTGINADSPPWKRALCGVIPAFIGAMILWFNPAVIWDGHCWPQWDIWPVPFFLAAVLLANLDAWFCAGLCLAIGGSLKGQMLLGAPVLIMWPIFRGNLNAVLRLAGGFALLSGLIILPWMRIKPIASITLAATAAVIVTSFALLRIPAKIKIAAIGVLTSAAIFLLIPLFHVSTAWYTLGFKYGTEKFGNMIVGNGAYNIPRMLQVYFNWPRRTITLVGIPLTNIAISFTLLTRIVYALTLIPCGIGAAMQDKRRDSRFLAAIVAPWLLFFMILTQMHGRYDVWAAAICSLLAAVGYGPAFLAVIVGWIACMGIVHNQLLFTRDWAPDTLRQFQQLDPSPGFVLLLITGIVVYLSVLPRRKTSAAPAASTATAADLSPTPPPPPAPLPQADSPLAPAAAG